MFRFRASFQRVRQLKTALNCFDCGVVEGIMRGQVSPGTGDDGQLCTHVGGIVCHFLNRSGLSF